MNRTPSQLHDVRLHSKTKTVQKWEKDLKVKLDKVIEEGVVIKVKCGLCTKHVDSIKILKNLSRIWIIGSNSVKKDSSKNI